MKVQKLTTVLMLALMATTFSNALQATCTYEKNFSGEELEVGIMLSWSTISEENNAMFVIEKAEDGGEFISVGTVSGAGNSQETKSYDFFDIDIRGQYLLYRLRQIDLDGTSSYSKTLFISKSVANSFMVAQMSDVMAAEVFEVSIDAMTDSYLEYTLTDAKGEIVLQENINILRGINDIMIELDNSDVGIYKLRLRVDEEEEVLTFRKIINAEKSTKGVTARKE